MIYKKDDNNFILSCSCGCGEALSFVIPDFYEGYGDYCFINPVCYGTNKDKTSVWYNIKETFTNIVKLITGKNVYRVGICLTPGDIETLVKWFEKQLVKAKKNNLVPKEDSFISIFNSDIIEYRDGEEIYIGVDGDYSDIFELYFYSTRVHNYKLMQTIRQIFREFRRNKYMLPEIVFNRISFIHFCEYMIDTIRPYIEKEKC